jgi:hypothetical protein
MTALTRAEIRVMQETLLDTCAEFRKHTLPGSETDLRLIEMMSNLLRDLHEGAE